jgi:hypothetical protein
MYSSVLLRAIHYILSIRHRHPSTKIFFCVNLTSMQPTVIALFQGKQPLNAKPSRQYTTSGTLYDLWKVALPFNLESNLQDNN